MKRLISPHHYNSMEWRDGLETIENTFVAPLSVLLLECLLLPPLVAEIQCVFVERENDDDRKA